MLPRQNCCSAISCLRAACARPKPREKGVSVEDHATHLLVHGTLHLLGYDHADEAGAADMEAREGPGAGAARDRRSLSGRGLMATHHDDEGGSRLWRGMRHLLFGDDSEPTLRDQIEEAIEEAEDARPVAGDLTPVRADDAAQPAAFRRPHRGRHMRDPRRHHRRALDDQLRGAGPRLRRRRPQPPAGLSATASIRSSAWSTSRTCSCANVDAEPRPLDDRADARAAVRARIDGRDRAARADARRAHPPRPSWSTNSAAPKGW